jgi:DNA-binding transcriptional LysR family regulator
VPYGVSGRVSATEIRQLIALVAVADEGSFTRAALRLGYSQSAISHQIATLERLVDCRLVQRPTGSRSLQLTEAGERFRDHARDIIVRVHAAHAELEIWRGPETAGTLRVGSFATAGARLLPSLVRQLADAMPRLRIELTDAADAGDLLRAVEADELDATLALAPLPAGSLTGVELERDGYVAIAAADSPLGGRAEPVGLEEIAELPLIACGTRSEPGPETELRAAGHTPNVVVRTDDSATTHALAAAGVGVAIVPRRSVDTASGVAVIELAPGLAERTVMLAWHSERAGRSALSMFVRLAQSLRANGESWV